MTEISASYQANSINVPQNMHNPTVRARTISLPEYYRREKRKNNGLIEKLYNAIKNFTGLGIGTKKVEKVVNQANRGEITSEKAKEYIDKFSSSQENSAQLFGDGVSVFASLFTFFGFNKALKYTNAVTRDNHVFLEAVDKKASDIRIKLLTDKATANKEVKILGKKTTYGKAANYWINFYKNTVSILKSNKAMAAFAIGATAIAGGLSKYFVLKFNRIGSDEYKVDSQIYGRKRFRTPEQKKAAKNSKRNLKRERIDTNLRNLHSGIINGLMMPLIGLGGIVAAPLYFIGNSINRYVLANKTDKNKSLEGYYENLGQDFVPLALVSAALAVPFIKKANWTKLFNENMKRVSRRLEATTQKESEYVKKTSYKKMEEVLLDAPSIKDITNDRSLSVDERIKKLINENIFAAKFKQSCGDQSELAKALGEDCPSTRTLEQAQRFVTQKMGNSDYKLSKLLGVGTVAETYLAKDKNGREVVVKIIKEGISEKKILKDKEKFEKIIKNNKNINDKEKEYMIRNLEELSNGILKEVDLKNEMIAAPKIAKNTTLANVVKPIEVKNNVYVMEKADGVSLRSFIKLNDLYIQRDTVEKLIKDDKKSKKILEKIDEEIEKLKERMPDFEDIKLGKNDSEYLLEEYRKIFVEQFHKINKDGKSIHGDIHPGNIFINPKVLKTRKGTLYTLIDTGNSIDMSVDQSLRAINLSKYIKNGSCREIVEYMLEGATLPKGLSKEDAARKIELELKKCFFDETVQLSHMNDSSIFTLTDGIMQKLDIIPSSSQMSFFKCRNSALESYNNLQNSINHFGIVDAMSKENNTQKVMSGALVTMDALGKDKVFEKMIEFQEKQNLEQLPKTYKEMQKRTGTLSKNSEEYITYKLKQLMLGNIKFGD